MDNLPKESVLYIVHKFTAWKICQIRIQKPFWFQIYNYIYFRLFFFFFRLRLTTYVHNLWKPSRLVHPNSQEQVSHKRAPDLAWFNSYSLFGPLCFVSFFKFCLHVDCWYYWDISALLALGCNKASSKVGYSSWRFRLMGAHCWDFTK